jgi:hypothetical protein
MVTSLLINLLQEAELENSMFKALDENFSAGSAAAGTLQFCGSFTEL